MPHPLRDEAPLSRPEPDRPLAARLVQHDVEGARQEIEHLVARRVHLPLVGVEVGRLDAVLRPDHAVPVARHEPPEHVGRPRDGLRTAVLAQVHEGGVRIEGGAQRS